MPLFGGKHKTLHELVKIIRDGLVFLSSSDVKDEKKIQKVIYPYSFGANFALAKYSHVIYIS